MEYDNDIGPSETPHLRRAFVLTRSISTTPYQPIMDTQELSCTKDMLDMEEDFDHLLSLFLEAIPQISHEYFLLPIADSRSIYRERVYCYELYHQLRSRWEDCPYSLGGEVDKSGHPLFRETHYARAKPDLLVHVPGSMERNLAAVEVKPVTVTLKDLRLDVLKLRWFIRNAHYHAGILIVYGDGANAERVREALASPQIDNAHPLRIALLCHSEAGTTASHDWL